MADPKVPEAPFTNKDLLAAIAQLANATKPRHPLADAGMSPEQVALVTDPDVIEAKSHRSIACKSEETGATFDANINASRTFANGRVVGLGNYRHPPSAYIHQAQGGRVPDGLQIFSNAASSVRPGEEPRKGELTPYFLQWRYEEFWKADLRRYNGKELHAHLCVEGAKGLATPWQPGTVNGRRTAA